MDFGSLFRKALKAKQPKDIPWMFCKTWLQIGASTFDPVAAANCYTLVRQQGIVCGDTRDFDARVSGHNSTLSGSLLLASPVRPPPPFFT
jgi:hypothetical protein